jgi:phosphoadenosine phosphosulfate reductase
MLKSIELLQKAEKLALMYDPEDGYWLGMSFGKDSQALFHMAQLAGVKFKARFSPTSVDPPEVIRFGRRNYPEVEFLPLTTSIYQEFIKRKCLPSMSIRWCCSTFKENKAPNKVTLVGVRHAESARRAKRKSVEVSSHKFSGNLDEFNEWSEKTRAKKLKAAQNKAKKLKQFDQFSEHQEQMINCINGKDQIIISPIIEWTDADVWEFLNDVVRVPHCDLYDKGRHRIGCIMCPMASVKNTLRDIKEYPYVHEKWVKAIMEVRRQSFESEGFTPPTQLLPTVGAMGNDSTANPNNNWTNGGGDSLPQSRRTAQVRSNGTFSPSQTDSGGYNRFLSPTERAELGGAKSIAKTSPRNMVGKFLDGTNEQGAAVSAEKQAPKLYDPVKDRLVAERIVNWWISKLSYRAWYAKTFLQQKLDFGDENEIEDVESEEQQPNETPE